MGGGTVWGWHVIDAADGRGVFFRSGSVLDGAPGGRVLLDAVSLSKFGFDAPREVN